MRTDVSNHNEDDDDFVDAEDDWSDGDDEWTAALATGRSAFVGASERCFTLRLDAWHMSDCRSALPVYQVLQSSHIRRTLTPVGLWLNPLLLKVWHRSLCTGE